MLTFIVNLQKGLNVCVCHKLSECRLQLLHKIIRRLKWVYFGSQLSSAALTATLCWHILCIMVQKHWAACEPFAQTATTLCGTSVASHRVGTGNTLSSSFSLQSLPQSHETLYSVCPADFSNWLVKISSIYPWCGPSCSHTDFYQNVSINFLTFRTHPTKDNALLCFCHVGNNEPQRTKEHVFQMCLWKG